MPFPKLLAGFPLIAALLPAQTVNAPIAGLVLDSQNQLVPVHGVFGNLLRAQPISFSAREIDSASFSDRAGIIAAAGQIWFTDGAANVISQQPATQTPVLAAFAPDGSLAWFCTGACATLQNRSGPALAISLGGTVIALGQANGISLPVLIESGAQLWSLAVDTTSGAVTSQEPIAGTAPAAAFQNGWLTTTASGLLWSSPASPTPRSIPLPAAVRTIQNAGSRAVALNGRWLLNTAFQLLEIPAIPSIQSTPKRFQPAPVSPGAAVR